jgi:hypothetical protein
MSKYCFLLLIIFLPVIFSCKKQTPAQIERAASFHKADSAARVFLDSISISKKENDNIWQLHEFDIFGYGTFFPENYAVKFELVDSIFPNDTTSEITYKTWIEGVDFSFRHVKQIRNVAVTVKNNDGIYKVGDISFKEIKRLRTGWQFLCSALSAVFLFVIVLFFPGYPAIGLMIVTWIAGLFPQQSQDGCLIIILTIIFDIAASYSIYVFFNSIGAVLLGIVVCTLFMMFALGLIMKK